LYGHLLKSERDFCRSWIWLDVQNWMDTGYAEAEISHIRVFYNWLLLVRFTGPSHAAQELVLVHTLNITMLKLSISSSGRSCLEEVHYAISLSHLACESDTVV